MAAEDPDIVDPIVQVCILFRFALGFRVCSYFRFRVMVSGFSCWFLGLGSGLGLGFSKNNNFLIN
jgi:hypothetical protein